MTRKLRPYDEPPKAKRSLIPSRPDSAATLFLVVAILWLVAATGIGALAQMQLAFPDAITGSLKIPFGPGFTLQLTSATTQPAFVDALIFGWLSNAAFAAICFITPRLTGTRLATDGIATLSLLAWNAAVAGGVALLYVKGASGTAALAEFPLPVKGLALLGLLGINAVFWRTVLVVRGDRYISLFYFGIALLALLGLMALSTVPAVVSLGATNDQLLYAFYARAVATYWVLGTALATLYYLVPRATRNPLYSGGLALLGFVAWLAFAGLSAIGALVDPSVPYALTSLGTTGTLWLLAPTFMAVANLLGTIRGRWSLMLSTGTLSLAVVSLAFITATALLESVGALRSVQAWTADTAWPMGVLVFSALGGATFAYYALADHALPRVLHRSWSESILSDVLLWATFVGTSLAGFAMLAGGLVAGSLRSEGVPPHQLAGTLRWFELASAAGLGLASLGALALLVNAFLIYTAAPVVELAVPSSVTTSATSSATTPAASAAGR
jgi:cbb3-type cytochrome oxidase subunit 1